MLLQALRFLRFQAAQCHCAALDVFDQCRECGGHLTATAPLARSTLLGASKIVGVLGPLFIESHDIAPACQLTHDELVNTYLANERLASPEWQGVASEARTDAWTATFRQGTRDELDLLRKRLGQKALTEKEPLPRNTLVGEGLWIDWASVIAPDVIRIVDPDHSAVRKETLAHWYAAHPSPTAVCICSQAKMEPTSKPSHLIWMAQYESSTRLERWPAALLRCWNSVRPNHTRWWTIGRSATP